MLDRAPGRKYTAALPFAELALRPPLPRANTLAHMRQELPEGFALALRAPRDSVVSAQGALRMDAQLEAGLAWLLAAADACQARVVVIPTPAELTPGARSRDLLREYVARLPRVPGRIYAWAPGGVWEPDDTRSVCAELSLVHAFDPLETLRPAGPVAYGRLRALGHRTGFSLAALGDAITRLLAPGTTEAFLSIDAERAFDIAKRALQLAAAVEGEPGGAEDGDDEEDSADEDDLEGDDQDDEDEAEGDDEGEK